VMQGRVCLCAAGREFAAGASVGAPPPVLR
jgi:hypothetical protein